MSSERPTITLSQIIDDLENGITRLKSDSAYNAERGSIEEKYGLSASAVTEMFKHPLLRNKRVKVPKEPEFILIDDISEPATMPAPAEAENTESPENTESQETPETPETPEAVEETATMDEGSSVDPLF